MEAFRSPITLLPTDPESIEESREKLRNLERKIVQILLSNARSGRSDAQKVVNLCADIFNGKFWDTLSIVDGNPKFEGSPEEVAKHIKGAREWSTHYIARGPLREILDIVIGQALTSPKRQLIQPGKDLGHSILYERLVEHEGSIYAGSVGGNFVKRLNNGRFWESLVMMRPGDSQYGIDIAHDVLTNHYDDLDPRFATEGMALVDRFTHSNLDDMRLWRLGEEGLAKYIQLVDAVDGVLEPDQVQRLIRPYISTALKWDSENEQPYYNGDPDHYEPRGRFQDKFGAPIVKRHLGYANIKGHVAKCLISCYRHASDEHGEYSRFVDEVVKNSFDPNGIMHFVKFHIADNGKYQRLLDRADGHGVDLRVHTRVHTPF